MLHIINNFPKEYEVIIDQGTKELSNEALTLQSLQEDLQEKYDRMKTKKGGSREIQTNDNKVLFMWQNESQKEDCWELEANKDKRPKIGKITTNQVKKTKKELNKSRIQTLCVGNATRKGRYRQTVLKINNTKLV